MKQALIPALLLTANTLAGDPENCRDSFFASGAIQVQTVWSPASQSCWVSVTPRHVTDLVYRSFLFGDDGLLLVFNSYGEGPDHKATGAREYFLFPRRGYPAAKLNEDGDVVVSTASGNQALFSHKTAAFLKLSGGTIHEDEAVKETNQGGLEIERYNGVLLDLGFMMGASPASRPYGKSEFRDGFGHVCVVENKEVFTYPDSNDEEIDFRFKTDPALASWLEKRCPEIVTENLTAND